MPNRIEVFVPTAEQETRLRLRYADRDTLPAKMRLSLIDNGKPRARDLLRAIGVELRSALPIASTNLYTKASSGRPLRGDEARVLAARSHLVITGVGD